MGDGGLGQERRAEAVDLGGTVGNRRDMAQTIGKCPGWSGEGRWISENVIFHIHSQQSSHKQMVCGQLKKTVEN